MNKQIKNKLLLSLLLPLCLLGNHNFPVLEHLTNINNDNVDTSISNIGSFISDSKSHNITDTNFRDTKAKVKNAKVKNAKVKKAKVGIVDNGNSNSITSINDKNSNNNSLYILSEVFSFISLSTLCYFLFHNNNHRDNYYGNKIKQIVVIASICKEKIKVAFLENKASFISQGLLKKNNFEKYFHLTILDQSFS